MLETTGAEATRLLAAGRREGFAFKAARRCVIQGFRATSDPRSRGDFLQALQQLGAEPRIHRLHRPSRFGRMMRVHVSCSRDNWEEVFGEPECLEEVVVPSEKQILYRWKHSCSDGSADCVGHLFEQSPGIHWVVVMRITML